MCLQNHKVATHKDPEYSIPWLVTSGMLVVYLVVILEILGSYTWAEVGSILHS